MYVPTKYSHDVAISFYPRFCPKNCERKNWGFLLREQVKVANVVHELKAPLFSLYKIQVTLYLQISNQNCFLISSNEYQKPCIFCVLYIVIIRSCILYVIVWILCVRREGRTKKKIGYSDIPPPPTTSARK